MVHRKLTDTHGTPPEFPGAKGSYILVLGLPESGSITIGRLGRFYFSAGCYLYVGSALGPGGLAARLNHHVRLSPKPHWHIDYFRKQADILEIWYKEGTDRMEHKWSAQLSARTDIHIPVAGMGSSDCTCDAHFFQMV